MDKKFPLRKGRNGEPMVDAYCKVVWLCPRGGVIKQFGFYHDPYRKLHIQQTTRCPFFQSNISSSWWFWRWGHDYMERGVVASCQRKAVNKNPDQNPLVESYCKFIQTWKHKVQNCCEVSVIFHVYKHQDKKICSAQRRLEYMSSFGVDSWRPLDSAENNKINKFKKKKQHFK